MLILAALAWPLSLLLAEDPVGGLPSATQYGIAGVVFTALLLGSVAVYRDGRRREEAAALESRRREDRLSTALEAKDAELRELNEKMRTELIPLTLRTADAAAKVAGAFDQEVIYALKRAAQDQARRERG